MSHDTGEGCRSQWAVCMPGSPLRNESKWRLASAEDIYVSI